MISIYCGKQLGRLVVNEYQYSNRRVKSEDIRSNDSLYVLDIRTLLYIRSNIGPNILGESA